VLLVSVLYVDVVVNSGWVVLLVYVLMIDLLLLFDVMEDWLY